MRLHLTLTSGRLLCGQQGSQSVAGTDALLRRRPARDRELRSSARSAWRRHRSPQLSVCRRRVGRRTRCRQLLADRDGQAERCRPRSLVRHVLAHIADHPVTVLTSSCPSIAPGSWHLPKNTPLPSGVTLSSENSAASSRRRWAGWADAYSQTVQDAAALTRTIKPNLGEGRMKHSSNFWGDVWGHESCRRKRLAESQGEPSESSRDTIFFGPDGLRHLEQSTLLAA